MTQPAYDRWQVQMYCGVTQDVPYACLTATGRCQGSREDRPALWRASVRVMRQLSGARPLLQRWLARAVEAGDAVDDPLRVWLAALLRLAGVPDYPLAVTHHDDGAVRVVLGCPYHDAMRLALGSTSELLNWSQAALQQAGLQLSVRLWLQALAALPTQLPPPPVMALHHDLWKRGIGWQWLGGERTRVGEGVRQRLLQGAPSLPLDDPEAWRIPIYTVTGSVGKTTTARLLWQLLQGSGKRLAFAASDGAWVDDERLLEGDCIGGVTARALLRRPDVEAAVFEQGRGGMIRQGVPYARSDVAILLNVQAVHLGLDGVETLQDMADVKALGLRPARLAVLNLDDAQCRRIGGQRKPETCVWFSLTATAEVLRAASSTAAGALGVARDDEGEPRALLIWQAGQEVRRLSLEGVAPYHGMLGEKTLEELLAAVGAAWFGPLPLQDWDHALRGLRLDSRNHLFRTSVHRQGEVVFVLDKASEKNTLALLEQTIGEIARRENIVHRIVVLCRSAANPPERHLESCEVLHRFMDAFVCFDRPDTYTGKAALPLYAPGSIPPLLEAELLRLNAQHGCAKPVRVVPDWDAAELVLREQLATLTGKTLVLINQPTTSASALNQRIADFVQGLVVGPGSQEA